MIVQWNAAKYEPLGRCLYCPETADLQAEHIIPFGLLPKGGDWFIPKASCPACADITKKFEGVALGPMLGPLRHHLDLKTRRKKSGRMNLRRKTRHGLVWEQEIEIASFPKLCVGFRWPIPGLLSGAEPTSKFGGELVVRGDTAQIGNFTTDDVGYRIARVGTLDFARMLAKIAHAYAVARYGFDSFEPFLPPLIRGDTNLAPQFVGGDGRETPREQPNVLHEIFRLDAQKAGDVPYLGVAIQLFAMIGMPRYHVIVGRRLKEGPASEKRGDTIAVELPIPLR